MTSVAFLGSHPLGEQCLGLLDDHPDIEVKTVVTYPPDADTWWDGSLYDRAVDLGYDPLVIEEEDRVLDVPVDYLLSVYYPNILGERFLDHPRELPVNLHQAELPRYRGSNVFSHAILNARPDDHWQYGTTLHVMAPEVDAGDVLDRRFVEITETDTARSLYEKTCEASAELFESTLPAFVSDDLQEMRTPQESFDGPRYFYTKESLDGEKEIPLTDLRRDDPAVYDKIRALDFPPFEPAYADVQGERVYLTLSDYETVGDLG